MGIVVGYVGFDIADLVNTTTPYSLVMGSIENNQIT
jgi:hypothetical protein